MGAPRTIYRTTRRLLERIVAPLRADESITQFTLSIPDAQTTTVDSVEGWGNRPPAVLLCSGCGAQIGQKRSHHRIDCPNCYRDFSEHDFADLELVAMVCPRCGTEMKHGRRHPQTYDVPEWATCPDCQYHWDLSHWF
jgi:predicted RNA-binding Zn-ribbon protein involved in translation (DUF1610 family)